jgi:hypothetical protein
MHIPGAVSDTTCDHTLPTLWAITGTASCTAAATFPAPKLPTCVCAVPEQLQGHLKLTLAHGYFMQALPPNLCLCK